MFKNLLHEILWANLLPLQVRLSMRVSADNFLCIEIRGMHRTRRFHLLLIRKKPPAVMNSPRDTL